MFTCIYVHNVEETRQGKEGRDPTCTDVHICTCTYKYIIGIIPSLRLYIMYIYTYVHIYTCTYVHMYIYTKEGRMYIMPKEGEERKGGGEEPLCRPMNCQIRVEKKIG